MRYRIGRWRFQRKNMWLLIRLYVMIGRSTTLWMVMNINIVWSSHGEIRANQKKRQKKRRLWCCQMIRILAIRQCGILWFLVNIRITIRYFIGWDMMNSLIWTKSRKPRDAKSHGDEYVPVALSVSKCFFKRSEISIVIRFDMVYNRKYAY